MRSRKSHTHCTLNARQLHTPIYVLFHNGWDERARDTNETEEKKLNRYLHARNHSGSRVWVEYGDRVTETHNVLLHTFDDWSNCYFVRMNAYTNYVRNVIIKMFLIVEWRLFLFFAIYRKLFRNRCDHAEIITIIYLSQIRRIQRVLETI